MPQHGKSEGRAVQVARAFFQACTKLSDDNEDILPQEDAVDYKLSVFHLFAELFPEFANTGKNGLMRLQFNKLGYEMYEKEQSRRVPAVRAKPGNPGYGFRRARWRDTANVAQDARICEGIMSSIGVSKERIERIKKRVNDFRVEWDAVRRPSRPAGPGRPRAMKRSYDDLEATPMEAVGVSDDFVPTRACLQLGPPQASPSQLPPQLASHGMLEYAGPPWGHMGMMHSPGGLLGKFGYTMEEERWGMRHFMHEPAGGMLPEHHAHGSMHGAMPFQGSVDPFAFPHLACGPSGLEPSMSRGSQYPLAAPMGVYEMFAAGGDKSFMPSSGAHYNLNFEDELRDLMQDNENLRAYNVSLITERERLNFEIAQSESAGARLQSAGEKLLLVAARRLPHVMEVGKAFRIVLHCVAGKVENDPNNEAQRNAFKFVRTVYEEYSRFHGMPLHADLLMSHSSRPPLPEWTEREPQPSFSHSWRGPMDPYGGDAVGKQIGWREGRRDEMAAAVSSHTDMKQDERLRNVEEMRRRRAAGEANFDMMGGRNTGQGGGGGEGGAGRGQDGAGRGGGGVGYMYRSYLR